MESGSVKHTVFGCGFRRLAVRAKLCARQLVQMSGDSWEALAFVSGCSGPSTNCFGPPALGQARPAQGCKRVICYCQGNLVECVGMATFSASRCLSLKSSKCTRSDDFLNSNSLGCTWKSRVSPRRIPQGIAPSCVVYDCPKHRQPGRRSAGGGGVPADLV